MPSPSPSPPHSEGIGSSLFFSGSHSSIVSGAPRGWSRGASPQLDLLSGGAPPHSVDATEVPRPEMRNGGRRSGSGSGSIGSGKSGAHTGTSSALASSTSPGSGHRPQSEGSTERHASARNGVQDAAHRYPTAQSSFEYAAHGLPPHARHQDHGGPAHHAEWWEWEEEEEEYDAMGGTGRGSSADKLLRSPESLPSELLRRPRPAAAGAQRTHPVSSSTSATTVATATAAARIAAAVRRLSSDDDDDDDDHDSSSSTRDSARSSASDAAVVRRDATGLRATATTTTAAITRATASTAQAGGGAVRRPASAPRPVLDDPLAALTQAQVEGALQVYVNRGGIRASEVAAVLQTLPWCTAGAAHTAASAQTHALDAEAALEEAGKDDGGDEAAMLDPEAWLSAVAAAAAVAPAEEDAAVAAAAAPHVEAAPAVPAAATSPTAKPRAAGAVLPTSASHVAATDDQLDPSPPHAVERTAKKRRSTGDSDSSAVLAAMALAEADRRRQAGTDAMAGAASGGPTTTHEVAGKQQHHLQHGMHAVAQRSASTDRRLEYDDDDEEEGEEEWASAAVEAGFAFPQTALLSSSSSSVLLSSGRPPPARSMKDIGQKPYTASLKPQTNAGTSTATATAAGAAARKSSLPRDVGAPRSPPASAAAAAADTTASAVAAPSPAPSLAPVSVPSAAALAGMRLLFQRCLHTPLASASALLTDSDWYALVEQLRAEGRHKLPPQPILDDVARAIAQTMESEQRPTGLSLKDFVRLLHLQLEEVRADMTSPAAPPPPAEVDGDTASATATSPPGQLHFPSQPQYVLSVFGAPTSRGSDAVHPGPGAPRRSRVSALSGTTGTGQWRVLPTWCMALAGLFPVEMAAVCPVPIVRYLRSVGLMHAVLDAILQRLQLEVEALPELVPPPELGPPSKAGRRKSRKKTRGGSAQLGGKGAAASPAAGARDADTGTDEDNFVWPPSQEGSLRSGSVLRSRPASGRGASPGAGARPPSSVVLMGSVVLEDAAGSAAVGPGKPAEAAGHLAWQEQPSWNSGKHGGRPPTTVRSQSNGAAADRGAPGGVTDDAAAKQRAAPPPPQPLHLRDPRPLDEISASVVARAKARRLMDTLRRHTVPINRYECFARVEQEDEPVQKALCFVSKKELNATFGGGDDADGDTGDGAKGGDIDDDSDAMSDMIAALTYDPADELATSHGASAGDGKRETVKPPMDPGRSSVRPPQLPRMSASNVLPTVVMGASRATRNGRVRRSSASASGAGAPPTLNGAAAGGSAGAAPPPVSGMFRMSGVLSTALPRRQEEALVQRLSKPVCDPAAMGLRASSSGVMTGLSSGGAGGGLPFRTTPHSTPRDRPAAAAAAAATPGMNLAATTTAPAIAAASAAAPMAIEDRPTARPASGPVPRRRQLPLSTPHGTVGSSAGATRPPRSQPTPVWTDGFCAAVCASGRDLRAFRPQRTPLAKAAMTPTSPGNPDITGTTDSTGISADTTALTTGAAAAATAAAAAAAASSSLTVEQNRGFFFFNVPSVLVAAPLSSSAAASAAAQVICGGNNATGQPHTHPHHPPHPTLPGNAKGGTALARQSRSTPYRQDGLRPGASKRGTGVRTSAVLPARTKARHGTPSSASPYAHARPRTTPDLYEEMSRMAGDTRQQLTPRSPTSPSHQHISLYERRLQRQLQLAYANEHAYHHFDE